MHPAAFEFVRQSLRKLPPRQDIVEFGGRDINGSVRVLFSEHRPKYVSLDLYSGPGVDVVTDAAMYNPDNYIDTVVCCEVLEHCQGWPDLVKNAGRILDPVTGVLILTCACPPRQPHSTHDGGSLHPDEYYANVDPLELTAVLDTAGFEEYETTVLEHAGDLQVLAWKKSPT